MFFPSWTPPASGYPRNPYTATYRRTRARLRSTNGRGRLSEGSGPEELVHGIGNNVYNAYPTKRKPDDGTRNPISVVAYPVPITPAKTKTYGYDIDVRVHPTQKPIALLEYLIRTYTNEGEIVLDNCMGSGSTGVACINTDRNFIGIELDETYFNVASKRIERATIFTKDKCAGTDNMQGLV